MDKSNQFLSNSPLDFMNEIWNYEIKRFPIKRLFDVFFSLICLILGTPLYLIIALCVYCSSPGKIFYYQERIGRAGKIFRCYKFRSMYPDADKRLKEIIECDPVLRAEWNQSFKLKNDPRITFVGSFLRKTSLDELPQFWNVLKGDLSVVGPRPVIKEEFEKHFGIKGYKILSIRPGLTGLWQVSGRSDISSYKERVLLDEHYVDNHSLALDMKIILKTIPVMLNSKGAY